MRDRNVKNTVCFFFLMRRAADNFWSHYLGTTDAANT